MRRVIVGLLPSALALAWFIVRVNAFWIRRPEWGIGGLVPILFLWLGREAWRNRPGPVFRWSWRGLVMLGLGMAGAVEAQVYRMAFGETTVSLFILGCGLLLVMAADVDFVFGSRGLWVFGFPLIFLGLALPMPATLAHPLVSGLREGIASGTVHLLDVAGVPAYRSGSAIGLAGGMVGIDAACSGIRGLRATFIATGFGGYVVLRGCWLRILLVALGGVMAVCGNLARTFCLSLVAQAEGVEAVKDFHDPAGWLVLGFTLGGVILLAWWLSRVEPVRARGCADSTVDITRAAEES